MDAEALIGSLVRGALTGRSRRRRGRRAVRFLTGGHGGFLGGSTLLSAAAVAWGLYEAAQSKQEREAQWGGEPQAGPAPPPPPGPAPADPAAAGELGFPLEVVRLIRLTISAARADGNLAPEEGQEIARHAGDAGAEALVRAELENPRPLAEIVAGVADPVQRAELYTLAFSIARADETVSGAERIYLAQLAKLLDLDPATTARLEQEAAAAIDEEAER